MSRSFRAPLTRFTPCREETMIAIDRLLEAGDRPGCLRLDLFVASTEILTIIKDDAALYQIDDKGHAQSMPADEMSTSQRPLFLEVLAASMRIAIWLNLSPLTPCLGGLSVL